MTLPDSVTSQLKMHAATLAKQGKLKEAAEALFAAGDTEGLRRAGDEWYRAGHVEDACEALLMAIDIEGLERIALELWESGDQENAVQAFCSIRMLEIATRK